MCSFSNKLQPWKTLVETKVENPGNSRNDSIFQIPSSPTYPPPPISMLNWLSFVFKSLRLCQQQ